MAEIKTTEISYSREPGVFKKDFSWDQSNAIIDNVVASFERLYGSGLRVVRSPSLFDGRRCEYATMGTGFFNVNVTYHPPESKKKARVVATITPPEDLTTKEEELRTLENAIASALSQ
ncbi:hypothetical protein HYX06_06155 [Candidatus Woesearchaeota archaeon]|nr:hypothetical protein [Candidatus Woesearchaeota archaeon]